MLPGDEDPEKNRRRHLKREIVRIDLPTVPLGTPLTPLPSLPAGTSATLKKTPASRIEFEFQKENWTAVILLILAIWTFIGAVVAMMLTFNFAHGGSNLANPITFFVLLLFWAIPAHFIRFRNTRAGTQPS